MTAEEKHTVSPVSQLDPSTLKAPSIRSMYSQPLALQANNEEMMNRTPLIPQLPADTYVAPQDVGEAALTVIRETWNEDGRTLLSEKRLPDWRGSLTLFDTFFKTKPFRTLENVPWDEAVSKLCPIHPAIISDKRLGKFAVPCLLRDAPLVSTTREYAEIRGLPLIGKMRSKGHVTVASMLMADIDGSTEEDLTACLEQLKAEGITFVAYSTHSHGSLEKPGMRVRIVMPLDRPATPEEYPLVWHGFVKKFLRGDIQQVDSSGAQLHQQQGVFCCHPSRIRQARRWAFEGGVASADFLIALGRTFRPSKSVPESFDEADQTPTTSFPLEIIVELLDWVDPDLPEQRWFRIIGAICNSTNGAPEALEVVDNWSSKGRKKYKDFHDVERRWNYFIQNQNSQIKVNIATLIWEARQAGADINAILHGESFEVCEYEEGSDESDPAAPPERPPVLSPLAAMQQKFGLINFSGKLCVFDREALSARTAQHTARKLFLSSRSDGALLIERALLAEFPQAIDSGRMVSEFFVNPNTVCYHGTEFNPQGTSPRYLNLWEGPTITPKAGHWLLIQEFLHDVVCNGDRDSYLYLLYYIAHALQKPEEKPGVMIILLSGQGTGKGTLGRILQKIWSATYIQVNNIDAVVGTFNAVLERAYIVFMDEALFAGNRRGTDELKSIVTEPIIQISEKYQPSRQIRSCHRFFAATNADHFKNTERDDRRDFTLRVSEVRKGDHDYWKTLNEEIECGGIEAMVHDLLLMDLSDFNVRNKPSTKELIEQKLHSLDPIQRWWHDCLYNGCVGDGDVWPEFISTQETIDGINAVNGGRIHKKPSALTVSQALHKLCPSVENHQKQMPLGRHRGYLLPMLPQARAEFEKFIGGNVDWPEYQDSTSVNADEEELTVPY